MRDSPPNSHEEEADAGDLENPSIPLHHWRYQYSVPRRKSFQSLVENPSRNRDHGDIQNGPTNYEDRKPSGGSGSGDRSSDGQNYAPFGRKQLSSLNQVPSNEGLRENPFRDRSKCSNRRDRISRSRSNCRFGADDNIVRS